MELRLPCSNTALWPCFAKRKHHRSVIQEFQFIRQMSITIVGSPDTGHWTSQIRGNVVTGLCITPGLLAMPGSPTAKIPSVTGTYVNKELSSKLEHHESCIMDSQKTCVEFLLDLKHLCDSSTPASPHQHNGKEAVISRHAWVRAMGCLHCKTKVVVMKTLWCCWRYRMLSSWYQFIYHWCRHHSIFVVAGVDCYTVLTWWL